MYSRDYIRRPYLQRFIQNVGGNTTKRIWGTPRGFGAKFRTSCFCRACKTTRRNQKELRVLTLRGRGLVPRCMYTSYQLTRVFWESNHGRRYDGRHTVPAMLFHPCPRHVFLGLDGKTDEPMSRRDVTTSTTKCSSLAGPQ